MNGKDRNGSLTELKFLFFFKIEGKNEMSI